ncbi:hypothetical protein BaRGS_00013562 [Batillaria attramentaria]|uniref:Uncharacterized protein n=1 Tax=Batillaria attramentaria TaxID=370345 RepID=A0ABD0L6R1_9CAEN
MLNVVCLAGSLLHKHPLLQTSISSFCKKHPHSFSTVQARIFRDTQEVVSARGAGLCPHSFIYMARHLGHRHTLSRTSVYRDPQDAARRSEVECLYVWILSD